MTAAPVINRRINDRRLYLLAAIGDLIWSATDCRRFVTAPRLGRRF